MLRSLNIGLIEVRQGPDGSQAGANTGIILAFQIPTPPSPETGQADNAGDGARARNCL